MILFKRGAEFCKQPVENTFYSAHRNKYLTHWIISTHSALLLQNFEAPIFLENFSLFSSICAQLPLFTAPPPHNLTRAELRGDVLSQF